MAIGQTWIALAFFEQLLARQVLLYGPSLALEVQKGAPCQAEQRLQVAR